MKNCEIPNGFTDQVYKPMKHVILLFYEEEKVTFGAYEDDEIKIKPYYYEDGSNTKKAPKVMDTSEPESGSNFDINDVDFIEETVTKTTNETDQPDNDQNVSNSLVNDLTVHAPNSDYSVPEI